MTDTDAQSGISVEELQLATRNHGMPLEALAQPITPVGLHYLLIHFDIPFLDPAAWSLEIAGRVRAPARLTLAELRERPRTSTVVTMECAGNGRARMHPRPLSQPWLEEAVGTAEWTGTPLRPLLEELGLDSRAVDIVFTGADRGIDGGVEQAYARALPAADALGDDVLVAYEMNGAPLLPQHGAPVRLVCPGWYGMTNVKWLTRIEVIDSTFDGYQQTHAYRLRANDTDPGAPLSRMHPRALLCPPGVPDFFTRRRIVEPGDVLLTGRTWSGFAPITAVEVSTDGGRTWSTAEVDPPQLGAHAWQQWRFRWHPAHGGEHTISCRATDAAGHSHASLAAWNVGGYANRAPHTVTVTVRAPRAVDHP